MVTMNAGSTNTMSHLCLAATYVGNNSAAYLIIVVVIVIIIVVINLWLSTRWNLLNCFVLFSSASAEWLSSPHQSSLGVAFLLCLSLIHISEPTRPY